MANQRSVHLPEGQCVSPRTKRKYQNQDSRIANELVLEMRKWCNTMPYYDFTANRLTMNLFEY
jgi:hypothetical protein